MTAARSPVEYGGALAGKVIVVTGGGRGIGRAIAIAAAAQGASVVVADIGSPVDRFDERSSEPADDVVETIITSGGSAVAAFTDVSTMDGAESVVRTATENFGSIDGIVCCAGILHHGRVHEITEAEWWKVIHVHLGGHFACTNAAAREMIARGIRGRIVHFASAAALKAPEIQPAYAAAKAGVMAFSKSSARALHAYGITVNCVLPGASTRMTDKVWADQPERVDVAGLSLASDRSAGTWRDPANVAPFVLYLLRDEAAGINGKVFGVVGYQVTVVKEASYGPSIVSDGPWSQMELSRKVPSLPVFDGPSDSPWPPPIVD